MSKLPVLGLALIALAAFFMLKDVSAGGRAAYPEAAQAAAEAGGGADALAAFRDKRDSARAVEAAYLSGIVDLPGVSRSARDEAERALLEAAARAGTEARAEALLEASGTQAAVLISSGTVNVAVAEDALSRERLAAILFAVCRATGAEPEQVYVFSACR